MTETSRPSTGGAAGVVRELLRTPAFREIAKIHMVAPDPEKTRELVRTLLREDPNFALSLAAATPDIVNALVEALIEAVEQIGSLPEPLVEDFVGQAVARIDRARLATLGRALKNLAPAAVPDGAALGEMVSTGARSLNRAFDGDPGEFHAFFANLDFRALAKAGWRIGKAMFAGLFRRLTGKRHGR